MAQRDRASNIALVKASISMAEASSRDNEIMKELAADSRRIALTTQKDSAAMRVISIMTMVFLPGTFIAVGALANTSSRGGSYPADEYCRVFLGLTSGA